MSLEQTLGTQHWSGLSHFQEGTDQLEGSHSLSLSHSSQLLASQGGLVVWPHKKTHDSRRQKDWPGHQENK